jgi:hypothetical protein
MRGGTVLTSIEARSEVGQIMRGKRFFGWRVVRGAFVLGALGWGTGFYGPPIFLGVIHQARGWAVGLIASAITLHFLTGALFGANLPALHARFGASAITKFCSLVMAAGLISWSIAWHPWQLFAAGLMTGVGWGGMSAAALNVIVSPWFEQRRPSALGMAYNGGSIGGVIFSPLWIAAIGAVGFVNATLLIAVTLVAIVWVLATTLFSRTPEQMGLAPDGGECLSGLPAAIARSSIQPLPGALLWSDWRFRTLAAGMALGLFAQIGLVAHLYSLLVPALGPQMSGFAMALVTAMAIGGRTVLGRTMPPAADRRLVACVGYTAQLLGSLSFVAAQGTSIPLLVLGVVLFGAGFGNATSLPPLIAQTEFSRSDVQRAVALVVGIGQGFYAFAPATFGLIRELAPPGAIAGSAPYLFAFAAFVQGLAIVAFLAGRRHRVRLPA